MVVIAALAVGGAGYYLKIYKPKKDLDDAEDFDDLTGEEENCMLERNRFLVEHASTLLAVYNGERRGGTAATMRYAQKMGREIIVIDPITRLISYGESASPQVYPK